MVNNNNNNQKLGLFSVFLSFCRLLLAHHHHHIPLRRLLTASAKFNGTALKVFKCNTQTKNREMKTMPTKMPKKMHSPHLGWPESACALVGSIDGFASFLCIHQSKKRHRKLFGIYYTNTHQAPDTRIPNTVADRPALGIRVSRLVISIL